jgi:hypothetical protein
MFVFSTRNNGGSAKDIDTGMVKTQVEDLS